MFVLTWLWLFLARWLPVGMRGFLPFYGLVQGVVWSFATRPATERMEYVKIVMTWPEALRALRVAGGIYPACKLILGNGVLAPSIREGFTSEHMPLPPTYRTVAGLFITLASFEGEVPPYLKENR